MSVYRALDWHEGEHEIHRLTKVDRHDNPTHPGLTGWLSQRISVSPTIALGAVDDKDNVWCTIWGGELPIAQQVARGGIIGIRSNVDASFDPVVQALYEGRDDGEVVRGTPEDGKMVSGLSIKLEERDRVKFFGRMMAGSLTADETSGEQNGAVGTGKTGNAQLVMQIQQSLGNCPKYLNKKTIFPIPNAPKPQLVSDSPILGQQAIDHIHQADLFFVASRGPEDDMDCNHRGGKPGFLRVVQQDENTVSENGENGTVLVWPEYSGNNLYQTLGNIQSTHTVGLVIPNFETGDVLYVSGHADVLLDHAAISLISKTRLAVKLIVKEARFVRNGLTFRGKPIDDASHGFSPYNPKIRYLTTERPLQDYEKGSLPPIDNRHREHDDVTAQIVDKQQLTPTIFRYRFKMSDNYANSFPTDDAGLVYKAGQYVALDFSDELFMGYSHMNDGDPGALNDDYLRTFTVASSPRSENIGKDEFEMVIRKVGAVTNWMSWQRPDRVHVKVGVKGFAGDFQFETSKKSVFIAAGIGITPLLGQLDQINDNMKILWTVGVNDIGLVEDALKICTDEVKKNMTIFVTGSEDSLTAEEAAKLEIVKTDAKLGKLERRRMQQDDVTSLEKHGDIENWYLCTAPAFRKIVQDWVPGKVLIFENFDY